MEGGDGRTERAREVVVTAVLRVVTTPLSFDAIADRRRDNGAASAGTLRM
jgi:hypothetical protein